MRLAIAVLLGLAALGSVTFAQGQPRYVIPSVPAPRDPLPRFTIAPRGGALAPVGLPLPRIGLQPQPQVEQPILGARPRTFYPWPALVFYVPQPVAVVAPAPEAAARPVERPPSPGRLIFEVSPPDAQIFADGYYIGVPADFSAARGGAALEAGVHRIDVSAPGYEPAAVDLRLIPGQSVTYRGALRALPPPAKVPPSTFYLIPGCYLGNIPPKDARLPASCDQNRVIVWRP